MKFRKKPVVIDAYKFEGDGIEAMNWAGECCEGGARGENTLFIRLGEGLKITTLEGEMHVSEGDWIIRGVKGEFYPCKPDIFEATYEPA